MAGHDHAFGLVVATARRTLQQVEEDPRVADPTPGRGVALASHVNTMAGLISAALDDCEAKYPGLHSDAARGALVRNLRLYTNLARSLHQALPWLDLSKRASLDLGSTYFADEMALAIVGPGVEVVTVADPEYMYSTLSWPFRLHARQHLKVDIASGVRPIVLFFPGKEADSVLFHSLFAHELGHAAVDAHLLVKAVLAPVQADANFQASLAAAVAHLQTTTGMDAGSAEGLARGRAAKWVEELLCDVLALQYLGPSYLFGFVAFVLASSWTDPSLRHPPTTLRVQLLAQQLADLGWDTWVKGSRPAFWAWIEWVASQPLPPMAADNKFLTDLAVERAAAVRAEAAQRVGAATYQPADFAQVESDLDARLRQRILPAELDGTAVDRRHILLAGWSYALCCTPDGQSRDDEPAALSAALAETDFQRFIGKALELSTVAEVWSALP